MVNRILIRALEDQSIANELDRLFQTDEDLAELYHTMKRSLSTSASRVKRHFLAANGNRTNHLPKWAKYSGF
jgi:hypothetical protein